MSIVARATIGGMAKKIRSGYQAIQESYQALIGLDAAEKSSGLFPTLLLSRTVAGIVV